MTEKFTFTSTTRQKKQSLELHNKRINNKNVYKCFQENTNKNVLGFIFLNKKLAMASTCQLSLRINSHKCEN